MWKFAFKYGIIILLNLFAFFIVWLILDTIFTGDGKITIVMLIASVIPLIFISMSMVKKTLYDLDNIDTKKNND